MQLSNKDVVIKSSPIHGWGVFTQEPITGDDIVLQCIITKIPIGYHPPKDLMTYVYAFQGNLFLALGPASLINSSNEPNTKFSIDKEVGVITVTATRDILTNEEITLKYL